MHFGHFSTKQPLDEVLCFNHEIVAEIPNLSQQYAMCGIVGFYEEGLSSTELSVIIGRMASTLRHRGPDGEGFWTDGEQGLALGHRRLAILDLSPTGAER